MAKTDASTVFTKLYELLEPLEPAVRKRAVKAAFALLGDEEADLEPENAKKKDDDGADDGSGLPRRVKTWMRSHSVSEDQLHQVFHIEKGKVELIAAESPGKNGKKRTINAYILTGLTQLLQSGEPKFDDKAARAVCKSLGCLDEGNHAYNLRGKGNMIGGSKDAGWTLTGPGLKSGAELVKSMAGTA